MDTISYSVVVPVFNSVQSLSLLCESIMEVFAELDATFEIILVNDASQDRSWQQIETLCSKFPSQIKGIDLARNSGQHNATFCGIEFACGQYVITIDDDMQVHPTQIKLLIEKEKQENCDLVYGIYHKRKHSFFRNLSSRLVRASYAQVLDRNEEVTSFRLISRELVNKLMEQNRNFIFLDELLAWHTRDIHLAEVEHSPRVYQKSNYRYGTLIDFFTNLLVFYTNIPLKLMVYLGLLMSIVFFSVSIYYLVLKVLFNVPMGYTSIIVGILFSTGLILFSLGIIGEYLSRLYLSINKKPPFIIRKVAK